MIRNRTSIGGLLLETVEDWRFSTRDSVIVGRRGEDSGIFRVMTVAPDALPQPFTHERILEVASEMADVRGLPGFAQLMMTSVCGPFGAASFYRERDLVRVWYCNRPAGLIVGTYACPAALSGTPHWKFVAGQCARMIFSAIFDRRSWGGDDELTRYLVEQLGAEDTALKDPPAAPPPPAQPPQAAKELEP